MNEALKKAYASKYFRTGAEVRLPKEENPYPQMKYDSVRLMSTPDFGNLNTASYWQYICAPLSLNPQMKKNDRDRYLTLLGGDMRNTLLLGGVVEITLGRSADALQSFEYDRAVAVFIPSGIYYSVNVKKIKDAKYPILYNELAFSPSIKETLPEDMTDYAGLFKSGEDIWLRPKQPTEALCPCVSFSSKALSGQEPLSRSWLPVSQPLEQENILHSHTFDQFLCFMGADPENMLELGGEIEFTIGEEGKEPITFSSTVACQFFIKKGLLHGMPVFKRVKNPSKPILFTETSFAEHDEQNDTL